MVTKATRRGSKVYSALTALLLASPLQALESGEFWTTFNLTEFNKGQWETRSHMELHFPELEYLNYVRFSQKFFYRANDALTLGLHPVVNFSRSSEESDWAHTFRLDLEASYRFRVGKLSGQTRSRYEVRRKEGSGSEAFDRFRQYTTLSYPANWLPGLTAIGVGYEAFFEFDDLRLSANRYYPIFTTFRVKDIRIRPYLMYQTKRVGKTEDWKEN